MPLDPKLNKYSTASPILMNFDFEDFADGTGTRTFYPTKTRTSAAAAYLMSTTILPFSGDVGQRFLVDAVTYSFDTEALELPKVVNGTAYVSAQLNKTGGNMAITVTIQKVDKDSNVTDVSSAVVSNTASSNDYMFLVPLPLTRTHFGKGDKLRCRFVIPETTGSSIWCDPTGVDGVPLKVYIPFEIPDQ